MPDGRAEDGLHAVTGAFGYSGKYIARCLLQQGYQVITLTNSPDRQNPFEGQVKAFPYSFDRPERLVETLRGVQVLYNTYWVRFNHPGFSFQDAVKNSSVLFDAAKEAGVERVVHVSITNPSPYSPYEYFSGKARVEQALMESGLSYAILRPAVLFGREDILINNIAWVLRRLPLFGVFGSGEYRLQPIYVEDLAELAVEQGQRAENVIIDAIGPETYTFRELVEEIGRAIGAPRPVIGVPPRLGYIAGSLLGWLKRDVLITWEEVQGLMADLLVVDSPPAGETRLSDWMGAHPDWLGRDYASELARRRDRVSEYE
jgi:NADH dehydrogenase